MCKYSKRAMRCDFCNKKNHLNMSCKWCARSVCQRCIIPEVHCCPNIDDLKTQGLDKLSNTLMSQRTVKDKVAKL